MYYKLDRREYETIRDVSDLTFENYELIGDLIPADNLMRVIESLLVEYHNLEEEFEDYRQEIEDNYEPVSPSRQVGVYDTDFFEKGGYNV